MATLIILLAVLLAAVRMFTPVLISDKAKIEAFVSRVMDQPVKINSVSVKWRGFIPMFTLHDVSIFDDRSQSKILALKKLVVGIDIFHSVINRDLNHSLLIATGASLALKVPDQNDSQSLPLVNNLKSHQDILEWLVTQRKILLQDWELAIRLPDKKIARFTLKTLSLTNKNNRHRFNFNLYSKDTNRFIKINANLSGSAINLSDWAGDFQLQTSHMKLPSWLQFFDDYGIYLSGGSNSFTIKGKMAKGNIHTLKTNFSSKNVKLTSAVAKDTQHIDSATGQLSWKRIDNGWQLSVDNVSLKLDNKQWPRNSFSFTVTQPTNDITQRVVYLKHLSIHNLHEFVVAHHILPAKLLQFFENIKINGHLKDTYFYHKSTENDPGTWTVQSKFNAVNTKPRNRIPGLSNLSGSLSIGEQQGKITLLTKKTLATFPNNGKPVPFDSLSGDFNWQVSSDIIKVIGNNIKAKSKHIDLSVNTSFVIPNNNDNVQANINGSYIIHSLDYVAQHFPLYFINKKQRHWLSKAITNAAKAKGSIAIVGNIADFPNIQKLDTFTLKASLSDLNLKYLPNWPIAHNIHAALSVNNKQLRLDVTKASVSKVKLKSLTATIDNLYADNAYIDITATMRSNLPVDWEFLYKSEFKDQFQLLKQLDLQGKVKSKLTLKVPLYKPLSQTLVFGEIDMDLSKFHMIGWDLKFSNIDGILYFTKNKVTAEKITATLFGEPANIDIKIVDTEDTNAYSNVTVRSIISKKILKEHFDIPFVSFIKGRSLYKANLTLDHDRSDHHIIHLRSALQGIEVDLPPPLAKRKDEKVNFALHAKFGATDKQTEVKIDYGNRLNAKIVYAVVDKKTVLDRATLWFGDSKAPKPQKSGIEIGGVINQFILEKWTPYFSPQAVAGKPSPYATDISKQIHAVNLTINQLTVFDQNFKSIKLNLKKSKSDTRWQVIGKTIDGVIDISTKPKDKITAKLRRFYMTPIAKQKIKKTLQPQSLPNLDITVDDFRYKDLKLGKVALKTSKIKHGARIDNFSSNTTTHSFKSRGLWIIKNKRAFTELKGYISSNNMTAFLKEWEILPSITAEKGNITFHLDWLAAPYNLAINNMSGKIIIDFRRGKLISLGEQANKQIALGRIITLLSIRALSTRLFSGLQGLSEKGFNYDRFKAHFNLRRGNAHATKAYFSGIVANIYAKGNINLTKKALDLMVTIKPHITASLPIIATIAAGPIAGAATWTANQLAASAVDNIAASQYKIVGPWDKPNVIKIKSKPRSRR